MPSVHCYGRHQQYPDADEQSSQRPLSRFHQRNRQGHHEQQEVEAQRAAFAAWNGVWCEKRPLGVAVYVGLHVAPGRAGAGRPRPLPPTGINHAWAYDFVFDTGGQLGGLRLRLIGGGACSFDVNVTVRSAA